MNIGAIQMGDDARYRSGYFPSELRGYYLAGDGAARDAETGYFTIVGASTTC